MTDRDSNSGTLDEPNDANDESASLLCQSLVELGESLPREEWDRVPTDLAENLHHYLYEVPDEDW